MDRKDGTGRGHRGDKKGGYGKGNWGKEDGQEEAKNEERRERRERREKEEQKVEEPVEMEEVGLSIDDFMNAKKANQKGLFQAKDARQHEKVDNKMIKESDYSHEMKKEFSTKNTQLQGKDLYAKRADDNNALLGFSADDDNARFHKRDNQQQRPKKGGRAKLTNADFPAL